VEGRRTKNDKLTSLILCDMHTMLVIPSCSVLLVFTVWYYLSLKQFTELHQLLFCTCVTLGLVPPSPFKNR